jgi:xanthine dehydrogenase YagS FAD-binding subunit
MASTGGNLVQRTRCFYFYDTATPCNKREPGSGCSAIGGINRIHAILGASDACIAVYPSDMAVALAVLDAGIELLGPGGATRSVAIGDFHRLPGDTPERDTNLPDGALITAVELPGLPWVRRSTYRKVRDRASYAFALVSVAACLDVDGGVVRDARIALGGVAHKPWRARRAEEALRGSPATDESYGAAADAELADARPLEGIDGGNAFKIPLVRGTLVSTLRELGREETPA